MPMVAPDVTVVGRGDLEPPGASCSHLPWRPVFRLDDALLVSIEVVDEASAWHTHGDRSAYGVVLNGELRVEYGADGGPDSNRESVTATAGEFFHVPAGTVHRDVADGDCVALVAFVGPGDPLVPDAVPGGMTGEDVTDEPRIAGRDDLVAASPLANLTRERPFPTAPVEQVRGHADGRVTSDWHHHGDNDVLGYVLDGEGYVEWGPGGDDRTLASAGEFFHVPAGTVHRDVNPKSDEQDYVLWLTGSEPRTVPVDGPPEG